jgi:cell wall-associated NlpC family hydrolase
MPLTDAQRENIVRVAKEWYGTPYRPHTCLKGVGCDCGTLLKGVYTEAGHQPEDGIPTPEHYSVQTYLHRKSTEYIDIIAKYMREIPESEVKPGDVVVYKLGHAFAHAAIIVEWPKHVIHSLNREGVHAGHGMNFRFGRLEKKFYTVKDDHC